MLRRRRFLSIGLVLAAVGHAAGLSTPDYARVTVAPTRTSIYIGTVAMTMPTFVRNDGTYSAPYQADVFPFFFEDEKGTLSVDVTDAELELLASGRTIEFTGRGVRDDGVVRRVEARATPHDPQSGALKVKVYVSKRIVLVFNTTYRFGKAAK